MAAGAWKSFDKFQYLVANGLLDLDGATKKMSLHLVAAAIDGTENNFAAIGSEHAANNGYTAGGITLSGGAVTQSTRDAKWTFSNLAPAWQASGGNIVFRWMVVYHSGVIDSETDPPLAYALGDSTPGDTTVPDGQDLNITFDATKGIFLFKGTV